MTGCAIVTGASRGFGVEIARALAADGRPVVTASRTAGIDVTDPDAVDALVDAALERHGAVDVLVNNAGAPALLRELDAMRWEDWRRNFDVDLRGVFNTTTRVAPLMRARGAAAIVTFAAGEGIAADEWLQRRFDGQKLTAAAVGAPVAELAGVPGNGGAWHLDAAGLTEWELFPAAPVAAAGR